MALGAFILANPTQAQQIKNVTVVADQPSYDGACPARITFTATINYTGSGNIQYTWLRSDGAHGPTKSLSLSGGGSQTVTTTWNIGKSYNGWQALKIISPAAYESAHAGFNLTCNGTAAAPARPAGLKPAAANGPVATVGGKPVPANGAVQSTTGSTIQIKDVQVRVDKQSYTGGCPVTLTFRATVHSTGTGVIRYTWVTSDGGSYPVVNKKLSGTGTDELTLHTWQLSKTYSGTATVKILSPAQNQSGGTSFQVTCGTRSPAPTTTLRGGPAAKPASPVHKQ